MSSRILAVACAVITASAALSLGVPVALVALLAAAAAASATDAWEFTIPNPVSALAAAAAVLVWAANGCPVEPLVVALIVGLLLTLLFDKGQMGGGDVKLIPSLVLAVVATGEPTLMWVRFFAFLLVLLSTGILWALARGEKHVPVAVGSALAVAVATI